MKIKSLLIRNFRSIKEASLELEPFFCLVGENNTGKSNILECIEVFLSDSEITFEHFYRNDEYVADEIDIRITFNLLKDIEYSSFIDYVVNDELIIGKKFMVEDHRIKKSVYICVKNPVQEWLKLDYRNLKRDVMEEYPIYELLPSSGRITINDFKEARREYIESNTDEIEWGEIEEIYESGLGSKISPFLPNMYFMHAISDVSTEIKSSGRSMFSNILGVIVDRIAGINPKFIELEDKLREIRQLIEGSETEEKLEQIKELESLIDDELSKWAVSTTIKANLPSASTIIRSSIDVLIDDGISTSPDEKGHGLQRSIVFALIRVWAKIKSETEHELIEGGYSKNNFFAFEEPEIFLHPQMERATYGALKSIADDDQVLICTHSSNFIDMNDYMNIGLVRKNSIKEGTKVSFINEDIFDGSQKNIFNMARYFNHDRNEIFFATKVVLVEGGCEKSTLPLLAKRLNIFNHEISIIDCMGKYNIKIFMEILNKFNIPYVVIHDEDPIEYEYAQGGEKEDPDKFRESKKIFNENQVISSRCSASFGHVEQISPNFERFIGITGSQSKKLGKPYAAIIKYSDLDQEISEEIKKIVLLVYAIPSWNEELSCYFYP